MINFSSWYAKLWSFSSLMSFISWINSSLVLEQIITTLLVYLKQCFFLRTIPASITFICFTIVCLFIRRGSDSKLIFYSFWLFQINFCRELQRFLNQDYHSSYHLSSLSSVASYQSESYNQKSRIREDEVGVRIRWIRIRNLWQCCRSQWSCWRWGKLWCSHDWWVWRRCCDWLSCSL